MSQSKFYFDILESIAEGLIDEIRLCDEELKFFSDMYKRNMMSGKDTEIDLETESLLKERKQDATRELKSFYQGLLHLKQRFFNGPLPEGVSGKGKQTGTFTIDPSCFEQHDVGNPKEAVNSGSGQAEPGEICPWDPDGA